MSKKMHLFADRATTAVLIASMPLAAESAHWYLTRFAIAETNERTLIFGALMFSAATALCAAFYKLVAALADHHEAYRFGGEVPITTKKTISSERASTVTLAVSLAGSWLLGAMALIQLRAMHGMPLSGMLGLG